MGTLGVCGEAEEIGIGCQQWIVTGWKVRKEDRVQDNPPCTSAVRELAGGGSISVLQMRDLADASEMGLGGPQAFVSAVSTPMGHLDRRSIALSSD